MQTVARRIVELQTAIVAGSGDSYSLQREQRELWERHFAARPYDEILAAASWVPRRADAEAVLVSQSNGS